ncbi:hypothetical protein CAPTEDRAFT_186982 [Capitella teleta]|uniref:Uncharacterized protein n=1 Tax=Capitella teleta TaxID=283909 RepID=R7VIU1_CAPTE|nr:hypothetical protein CAPTEDRAFT_186982 [Capitella teleta]|eukprot:ELU18549.1 hypothetical protein CAPTEDRAFT_186982 [Capitella teleta]
MQSEESLCGVYLTLCMVFVYLVIVIANMTGAIQFQDKWIFPLIISVPVVILLSVVIHAICYLHRGNPDHSSVSPETGTRNTEHQVNAVIQPTSFLASGSPAVDVIVYAPDEPCDFMDEMDFLLLF